MVHIFSSSNSFDLSCVEGHIINNICKNENEKIKDINLPVEGSFISEYSKLIDLVNKLQDKENNLSDNEIDNIYNEGKKLLKSLENKNNSKSLKTIAEEFELIYLSLKKNPNDVSWKHFKDSKINQLNLKYNHTKINETKILTEKKFASKLDPKLTNLEDVLQSTLNKYKNSSSRNLNNYFNYEAYGWLANHTDIDIDKIRCRYANILKNPDKDNNEKLLKLIIENNNKNNRNYRIVEIFEKLSLDQMKQLNKMDDKICNSSHYINSCLKKILPKNPREFNEENFKELDDFIKEISNSIYHNDLEYLYLYLKLKKDIIERKPYNEDDYISYLKIPYITLLQHSQKTLLRNRKNRSIPQNLSNESLSIDSNYMQEIEDDDSIIKIYLTYFFQKDENLDINYWKKYTTYINEFDLKKLFIEARLTKYPNELQILKKNFESFVDNTFLDKVELSFEKFTNPIKHNKKSEETVFRLLLKNINNLYVKEYEINTLAVCKENNEFEDSFYLNFDLSGLLPIKETTYSYNKNPLERWVEEFKFNYEQRCVYIIEFIGKSLACRAIVRNGDLRFIEKKEIYGQVIHIIDENNDFVTGDNYTVWYGNNAFKANEDGEFIIPYGSKRNSDYIILSDGKFAKKYDFYHQAEEYSCQASFILNNESITIGNKATLIVRVSPKLLNEIPVPCELIENAELNIKIESIDDISIDKSFTDVKFKNNNEATFEFTVPENAVSIEASLKGSIKISSQSGNKKYDIDQKKIFKFNSVDGTSEILDIQLKKNNDGYYLIAHGKNGERISNYVVELKMDNLFLYSPIEATLQTDENGIIELGKLPFIKLLRCNINKYEKSWNLISKQFDLPHLITIEEGEEINIAYPYDVTELQKYPNLWGLYSISLIDRISVVNDLSDTINFDTNNNIINIKNLKVGCYEMQLDFPYQNTTIRIVVGSKEKSQHITKLIVGPDDNLYYKLNNKEESIPLQVNTTVDDNNLNIQLCCNDPSTLRAHIILSNFYPNSSYYNDFFFDTSFPISEKFFADTEYLYNEDIEISKEKMYIQTRKLNKNLIGNMLRKPTTILVPLETKKATEEKQDAFDGGLVSNSYGTSDHARLYKNAMAKCAVGGMANYNYGTSGDDGIYSFNYNFLSHPGKFICNLIPNENGIISIPLSSINEDYSYMEIIAISSSGSISKTIDSRPLTSMTQNVTDVSMNSKLNKDKYYTEKREIATVATGESLEILASSGTRITTIESIAKVLSLASIINPSLSSDINEFLPILSKWKSFNFKEKSQKYSTHICNEFNIFIYFKDREFFNQVIMPFIKSKLVKCFIDKWLLNEDLIGYIEDSKKFSSLNDFELILLYHSFKDQEAIAEKLKNNLTHKIERMEKNIKSKTNEIKKIFDTIIEYGKELNNEDYEEDGSEDEDNNAIEEEVAVEEEEVEEEEEDYDEDVGFELDEVAPGGGRRSFFRSAPGAGLSRNGPLKMMRRQPMVMEAAAAPPPPMMAPGATAMALGAAPMSLSRNMMLEPKLMGVKMQSNSIKKLDSIKKKVQNEGAMFYEEIEKTTIWCETGNWKSSISDKVNIEMNPFWKDVFENSNTNKEGQVLSKNFIYILKKSFTELIFACALMDLPLSSKENQEITLNSQTYKINTKSNIVILYKQLMETEFQKNDTIICLRSYFDPEKEKLMKNDDDDENKNKANPNDFEPGKVYGCEIIITNVSVSTKFLDVLYQIPNGAICVNSSKKTSIERVKLNKYSSTNIQYYFYFPSVGQYTHIPVYVSYKEKYVIATSPETIINVSIKNNEDIVYNSWVDISSFGKNEDVLRWLKNDPSSIKQLNQVYWRLKDKSFFENVIEFYKMNCEYDSTLWSYGLYHDNIDISIEYLLNTPKYLNNYEFIYLTCQKIIIDKIESKEFTLLDYYPLINKRVHKLSEENGSKMISNKEFSDYYDDLLIYLFHKPINNYTSRDYLQFICCLLLQDRIADAIIIFKIFEEKFMNNNIPNSNSINGLIQRDYIASYLDFYDENYIDKHQDKKLKIARERSMKYDNYPIKNWNNMFSEIIQSIKYLDDKGKAVSTEDIEDKENRTLKMNNIIDNTPTLTMSIVHDTLNIKYRNLTQCKICYYPVDIEMQFSVQPFIISENKNNQKNEKKSNVTFTMPKDSELIELPEGKESIEIPLNKNYIHQHTIVEVQGGDDYFIKQKCIYQPSKLSIQMNENLGILRVFKPNPDTNNNNKPFVIAPGVYVKVYSKDKSDKVSFWKDGYTDLLGRFDYVTVSSNSNILNVKKFSILVLFNDTMGEIKEVNPPKM